MRLWKLLSEKNCLFSGFTQVGHHIVVFGASSFRKRGLYGLLCESILLNTYILWFTLYIYIRSLYGFTRRVNENSPVLRAPEILGELLRVQQEKESGLGLEKVWWLMSEWLNSQGTFYRKFQYLEAVFTLFRSFF